MVVVVIDTETTGFGHNARPPRDDAIIQVGIAWKGGTWEQYCWPGTEYMERADPKALEVNGVNIQSLSFCRHASEIADLLRMKLLLIGCTELRSYNMAFDRPFLDKHPWSLGHIPWGPCIMRQATLPGERWPKLSAAAERAGISLEGRQLHSAGEDALLAYEVMEWLERQNP